MGVSKLIEGSWEAEAIRLSVMEGKTLKEVANELQLRGYDVTEERVRKFSASLIKSIADSERAKDFQDLLLNNLDRAAKDFEEVNIKTKGLLEKFEKEDNAFMQLVVLKELREQIRIALVKLGAYKKDVINFHQTNIITNQDIVDKFRRMQIAMFEKMSASFDGNKLVYEKPSVEIIDAFNRYRAMKKGVIKSSDSDYVGTDVAIQ